MDRSRLTDFMKWCRYFFDNLSSDVDLQPRDYERMVEEYDRGLHPWEVSSAIAEGRETHTDPKWGGS